MIDGKLESANETDCVAERASRQAAGRPIALCYERMKNCDSSLKDFESEQHST